MNVLIHWETDTLGGACNFQLGGVDCSIFAAILWARGQLARGPVVTIFGVAFGCRWFMDETWKRP